DIQKKINEWKSAKVVKSAAKEGAGSEKGIDQGGISLPNPDIPNRNKSVESRGMENGADGIKTSSITSGGKTDAETLETMSINVPDPDFHDFD
ncbi:hypothetical protein IU460_29840, partial [Nocardia farcinica]|nr:hypothetical protein [Nocardia farcinica]